MAFVDDIDGMVQTAEKRDQFPKVNLELGEVVDALLENGDYLLLPCTSGMFLDLPFKRTSLPCSHSCCLAWLVRAVFR